MNNKNSGIVMTKGVNSLVFDGEGRELGHILLLDYDENSCITNEEIIKEITGLEGITLVFESSENNLHVWNLTVRDFEETALLKLKLHDDPHHNQIGYRRGFWTLRVTAKEYEKREIYKEKPELLNFWYIETKKRQSYPHLRFAEELYGVNHAFSDCKFVGAGCNIEQYLTMTDELKEKIRGTS